MKKSSEGRFVDFADTGISLLSRRDAPYRDAEYKVEVRKMVETVASTLQEAQRVSDAMAAHALFKSRMESESEDDFVTLEGPMTQEEVHERLNALMLQFSTK